MNILTLVLVVLFNSVAALNDEEVIQKWQIYQQKFGKSYRSPVEARKRLEIFKENLKTIEHHNALYEQGKVTHTEGINQFTDWTDDEFMQYINRGLIEAPVAVHKTINETRDLFENGSIDWRDSGILTPVKNQGNCAGWSFSATGAIEAQLGRKGNLISLSEQMLIDCSGNGNSCFEGFMTAAFYYVKYHGITSEKSYPFNPFSVGICRMDPYQVVANISGYVFIPAGDESSLIQAIASIGPISVTIHAKKELKNYSGGILMDDTCYSVKLNHGVLAVGYGVENGLEYYIIKNSWGPKWGEAGYFRLGRASSNPCGIASMASYPTL